MLQGLQSPEEIGNKDWGLVWVVREELSNEQTSDNNEIWPPFQPASLCKHWNLLRPVSEISAREQNSRWYDRANSKSYHLLVSKNYIIFLPAYMAGGSAYHTFAAKAC